MSYLNCINIRAQKDRAIVKEVGMRASASTHTPKYTYYPFPGGCSVLVRQDKKERTTEIYKQQSNFTIPTKIFCKVRDSMRETGQQRGRVRQATGEEREKQRKGEKNGG